MFVLFGPQQRLRFAKIAFKFLDSFHHKQASLNFAMKQRIFTQNVNLVSYEQFWNYRSKYFYLITTGWILTLIEALRRSELSVIHQVQASSLKPPISQNGSSKSWNFIADVVEKTAPAVVYIEIVGKHPFTGRSVAVANGSGFIVRSDGLIITNAHVVGNCKSVKVRLSDGTQKTGLVQAIDVVSDLATVKIPGKNLPTLQLGKSHLLRPGEFVVAMGSPLQLSNTVTAGIVSSANRKSEDLGLQNKGLTYIQTDANINYGNSGGPLVNLEGEAIGINTMTVTNGISFAIPSDFAKDFLSKAAEIEQSQNKAWSGGLTTGNHMPVKRYIGITMLTLTPDLANTLKIQHTYELMNSDRGVIVCKVVSGSPADGAGVRPGDVITEMSGKKIESSDDVYKALNSNCEDLVVVVIRGCETVKLTLKPEIVSW